MANRLELENGEVIVVHGIFADNHITKENGEVVECATYKIVRDKIDNMWAFFHLIKEKEFTTLIIFQYVLDDVRNHKEKGEC